jgi:hypothetical protein
MDENNIDKWTLYEISKYCDELVSNGQTNRDGTPAGEPRFSCNVSITTQDDAYNIVNSFASVFRGLSYYQGGKLQATFDSPKDISYTFTNANVTEGKFIYSNSSRKARHTVCLVKYNDKDEQFEPQTEYVEDVEGIKKYGIRVKDLTAFAVTSKNQAIRLAKYVLFTESLETQNVGFSAGLEGAYVSPGDIIGVSDVHRTSYETLAANRKGGRSKRIDLESSKETAWMFLDSNIKEYLDSHSKGIKEPFFLNVLTPVAYADPFNTKIDDSAAAENYVNKSAVQKLEFVKADVFYTGVQGVSHNYQTSGYGTALRSSPDDGGDFVTVLKITGNFSSSNNVFDAEDYNVTGFAGALYDKEGNEIAGKEFIEPKPDSFVWTIDASGGQDANDLETYRVVTVQEKEQFRYNISAIEYNPIKYPLIDDAYVDIPSATQVFPTKPYGLTKSVQRLGNTHAYKVTLTVTPSSNHRSEFDAGKLIGYKFFVKRGADFDASVDFSDDPYGIFPNNKFFMGFVSYPSSTTIFIPTVNSTYYFRVYSVNRLGQCKQEAGQFEATSANVSNVHLIQDLIITSLSHEFDSSPNEPGKKDAGEGGDYTTADITVGWQAGFSDELIAELEKDGLQGISIPNDFFYRVTHRKSSGSSSNSVHSQIRYETTGVSAGSFSNTLSISDNSNIGDSYGYAPYREMDIIVEAVDVNGNSSAGGTVTWDSNGDLVSEGGFNNSPGYDILYVNNPTIPSVTPTDNFGTNGASQQNCDTTDDPNFCTDMWLEGDGTLSLVVEKDVDGVLDDKGDLRNGVFIVSKTYFSPESIPNILLAVENDSSVSLAQKIKVDGYPSTYIIFSDGLSEDAVLGFSIETPFNDVGSETFVDDDDSEESPTSEIFANMAFTDEFLNSAIEATPTKKNILRHLNWATKTVSVKSKNSFLEGSLKWRAWAVFNINWDSKNILNYHSANFKNPTHEGYGGEYRVRQAKRMGGKGDGTAYKTFSITATRSGRRFEFVNPMPSALYDVIILWTPYPMRESYNGIEAPIFSGAFSTSLQYSLRIKNKYFFDIGDVSAGGFEQGSHPSNGCVFVGVLLGTAMYHHSKGLPSAATINADYIWNTQPYGYDFDRSAGQTPHSTYTDFGYFSFDFDAGSKGGGGWCVVFTHGVKTGFFTRKEKKEAMRWCIKNAHGTWYGEAFRRGYRSWGNKLIKNGKHEKAYKKVQNFMNFATKKKRNLKTAWFYYTMWVEFFFKGLFIKS